MLKSQTCKVLVFLFLVNECFTRRSCSMQDAVEDVAITVAAEAASLVYNHESRPKLSSRCRPRDCYDHLRKGETENGMYDVWPQGWAGCEFKVFCDMTSHGGGWTVFQRRGSFGNTKDYFYKKWRDYKFGFGKLTEEFWLGNDKIFHLTNQGNYELRVDLKSKDGENRYAFYEEFFIDNEENKYTLNIQGYSGDAGDSLSPHAKSPFTTKDRDNDSNDKNCAVAYKGAWWYYSCHQSNLNGYYHNGDHDSFADGVNWKHWKGYNYSYKDTEMKIRPSALLDL